MNILDVGSGTPNPYHIQFEHENTIHLDYNRTALQLDVLADAHNLPFKDKSFDVIYAVAILEHLHNPYQTLKEFKRVAKHKVIINVPNARRMFWHESPGHIYSWNQFTLYNLLRLFFPKVHITNFNRLARKTKLTRLKNLIYCTFWKPTQLQAICEVKRLERK